jgi:diguanylate cyclase (GGDEF)-like protein/PAS domain S-box-containing protein
MNEQCAPLASIRRLTVDDACFESRAMAQALCEAEQNYRSIFDNVSEGLFRMTPGGRFVSANPALARICDYVSPAELIFDMNDAGGPRYVDAGRRAEFMRALRLCGRVEHFESQIHGRSGAAIWISESAWPVYDEAGTLRFFDGCVENITDRKLREAQIEYHVNFDTLTGLANRRGLDEYLRGAILSADYYGQQLAVAFIDLDQFKFVNESFGHKAGDQLLCIVAQRLVSCLRTGDSLARHGGDEFVLLIEQPDEAVISSAMQKIMDAVSQPIRIGSHDVRITCSIGVSMYPLDGFDADTLLRNADAAMYRAKEQGRNNFQFYTRELNERISGRLAMESCLRQALEREEFYLEYQPQFAGDGRGISGVEALIRWRQGDGKIVSPAHFIPLAEEIGLIIPIGEWVLRTACAQNKAWQDAGLPPVCVSVNLSACQFRQYNLAGLIAQVLRDTGLEPRYLDLELTESMVMQNVDAAVATMQELKAMGVRLAIDDFGTGYSSLSCLKRFPLDVLKIDQSFVKDISGECDESSIIPAIVALARSRKLEIVAEGVETEAQLAYLQNLCCDRFQGYYFSCPVSADAYMKLLAAAAK